MNNIENLYDKWSETYDFGRNRTRDLEKDSLLWGLENVKTINHCLEIGCGTGKNTNTLLSKSQKVTSIDFSSKMLQKAKEKNLSKNVSFLKMDINNKWELPNEHFDFVAFSLILGHIKNLDHVFSQLHNVLRRDGLVYIGEMHPFKIYSGSKAWFDDGDFLLDVPCIQHNISDFTQAAKKANLSILDLNEYFDIGDTDSVFPRILSIILKK